jgi:hypothetical protein
MRFRSRGVVPIASVATFGHNEAMTRVRSNLVLRAVLVLALAGTAACNGDDEPIATPEAPTGATQPSTTAAPPTVATTTITTTTPATNPPTTAPPTVATTAPTTPPTTVDFFETIPDQPELGPDGLPITWIFGRTYEPFENYQVLPPFVEPPEAQPMVDAVLDTIVSVAAALRDPTNQVLVDRAVGTAVDPLATNLTAAFLERQADGIVVVPNPDSPDRLGPVESITLGTDRSTVVICAIESSITIQRTPDGDTPIDESTDAYRNVYEVVLVAGRWVTESFTFTIYEGETACPAG